MGLLFNKERIIDFQLTGKGRELLSKNSLNFVYYAFSDDGIDYSGSLSASLQISGSNLDDYIHINTFAFEPLRREDKTINNFLFTMPLENDVVTQFNSSLTGSFIMKRKYEVETLENIVNDASELDKIISHENVLDYVVVVEETPVSQQGRLNQYVSEQLQSVSAGLAQTKKSSTESLSELLKNK